MGDVEELTEKIASARKPFLDAMEEMGKVIVGQRSFVRSAFITLLAEGHLLVEGVPGLAKTLAVKTLSQLLGLEFSRIQFTPDLLPADLIGTMVYHPQQGTFSVKKGPIFTDLLLADEINRAPAKVQSALLEVMQERQVTIGKETFSMRDPYMVMATQNPIEQSGTYRLPEAQTDRFMIKVRLGYPTFEEEKEIVRRMATLEPIAPLRKLLTREQVLQSRPFIDQIFMDDKITDYILRIVFATRYPQQYGLPIQQYLEWGASPRASLHLTLAAKAQAFLEGRGFVTPQDVKTVTNGVLRHRLRLSYEAEAENLDADSLIDQILATLLVP